MARPDASPTLYAGFEYPTYPVQVTLAAQADKLACCNVDPQTFGDRADITAFAMEGIMAAKRAGISINGSVHVGQTFALTAPIHVGETLVLSGTVSAVVPEPRGHLVTSRFRLTRDDGSVPLEMERTSLRIDPEAGQKGPLGKAASNAPDLDSMVLLASKQLEPKKVARYSIEAENLIHSEPEVARRFGFRAPIAGGLMAVRSMMEALWRPGPVASLQMSVRFRRPMFWDERLDLYRDDAEGDPKTLLVVLPSGKVANEATITHLERG